MADDDSDCSCAGRNPTDPNASVYGWLVGIAVAFFAIRGAILSLVEVLENYQKLSQPHRFVAAYYYYLIVVPFELVWPCCSVLLLLVAIVAAAFFMPRRVHRLIDRIDQLIESVRNRRIGRCLLVSFAVAIPTALVLPGLVSLAAYVYSEATAPPKKIPGYDRR